MDITIDQAEAFVAIAKHGTMQKAAKSLNKGHSAIVYLIKSLETQTQLTLFDRSGYQNKISLEGEIILKYCRQILSGRNELEQICKKLQSGWEPSLKLIYDGVIDFNLIGDALIKLNEAQTPTEIKVLASYLHEVQARFEKENADMMVTILPFNKPDILSIKLKPFKMFLVAHKDHVLGKNKKVSLSALNRHTYIRVRDDANQLGLGTEQMDFSSSFYVNDFTTKKQAILKGLGYGWLPEYLIKEERKNKIIRVLKTEFKNEHFLYPRLYHQREEFMGKTTKQLLKYFKES